jgi:Fe-S oxidoreductase
MSKKTKEFVPQGLVYIADNIMSKQNILGAQKEEKAKWAKDISFSETKETIFFAGCGYQYSSSLASMMSLIRKTDKSVIGSDFAMSIASFQKRLGINAAEIYRKISTKESETEAQPLRDAVKVLKRLGLEFGYLAEDEPCCGGLLYYTGLRKDFARNAEETYKKLKSFGVKRIISIVPSCTYALRTLIPGCVEGYDIEVNHFSQVVLDNMQSKTLSFPNAVKVTYHDPCQLGRYLGIIDEPREILKAIKGIEFVEPEWTKGEWATCCGGGGGFEVVFPELSEMLAVSRTEELVKTGAKIIVTQCPGCIMQLKDGLKVLKVDNVEVLDLAEVVARAMEV